MGGGVGVRGHQVVAGPAGDESVSQRLKLQGQRLRVLQHLWRGEVEGQGGGGGGS